jgi:hypothetical protein
MHFLEIIEYEDLQVLQGNLKKSCGIRENKNAGYFLVINST